MVTETGTPAAAALERVGLSTAIDRIRELKALIALEIEQTHGKPAGVLGNGTTTVTSPTNSWTMPVTGYVSAPSTHQVAMLVNFPELEPAGGPGGTGNPLPGPERYSNCRLLGPGNPSDFAFQCTTPEQLIETINGCANTKLYQEQYDPVLILGTAVGSFTFGGNQIARAQSGSDYASQCPSANPGCATAQYIQEFGNVSLNDVKIIEQTPCSTRWMYAQNSVAVPYELTNPVSRMYGLCCTPAN